MWVALFTTNLPFRPADSRVSPSDESHHPASGMQSAITFPVPGRAKTAQYGGHVAGPAFDADGAPRPPCHRSGRASKRSTAWSRNPSLAALSASVSPPPCAYLTSTRRRPAAASRSTSSSADRVAPDLQRPVFQLCRGLPCLYGGSPSKFPPTELKVPEKSLAAALVLRLPTHRPTAAHYLATL